MSELSVYKQLTSGVSECLNAVKREIGLKSTCVPFAVKLTEAMKTLNIQTEQEALNAANTVLSGLQTLMQGGITAEDYDKIDFVKRGKLIVPSARVEAFLRASARKGYRITDTIVAVPKEDSETTYFKENFYNGDIVYTLEDKRNNADRAVDAKRLVERYFAKFICRLDIHNIKQNKRVAMTVCEIPIEDLIAIASSSEQGLYKSKWIEEQTKWGPKKKKVISNELNTDTFWVKWTSEMVNKTIIRRALKRIKEVLPELQDSIYAFEQDDYVENTEPAQEQQLIEIPLKEEKDIDLDNLTDEQKAECRETLELYKVNPKLADDKIKEIQGLFKNGKTMQEVINAEYASISVLKYNERWNQIGGYFNEKSKA